MSLRTGREVKIEFSMCVVIHRISKLLRINYRAV